MANNKLYRVENHSDKEIRLNYAVLPPRGHVIVDEQEVLSTLNVRYLTVTAFDATEAARKLEKLEHEIDKLKLQNQMLAEDNKQKSNEIARLERVLDMLDRQQSVILSSTPVQFAKTPKVSDTLDNAPSIPEKTFQPKPTLADTSAVRTVNIQEKPRGKTNVASKRKKLSTLKKGKDKAGTE